PVSRLRIAARPDQPGVLPFAQGGGADAELSGQRADEGVTALLRNGRQVAERGFDGLEGAAVLEKLGMAVVDEPQRVLDGSPVDRLHDRRGRAVTMPGREGEERAQGVRVQRRI